MSRDSTPKKGIRVTVEDLETGDTQSSEIMEDYVLLCAGIFNVTSQQVHVNGMVQLTIKGRRKGAAL